MPFPEFTPGHKKLLFFSRGKGRGHAIPDLQITDALRGLRHDVDIRFVSYATGARTIEEFNEPLIDVCLPEIGAMAEMAVAAGQIIARLKPDLVVSHEEFTVLTAAKVFECKTVFVTDWFEDPSLFKMHTLKFADEVLFIGHPGMFEEPPWVKDKIHYVGPVLRRFRYSRSDRKRARSELGIPAEAFVLSVFPGSWTEEQAPILDLVTQAFELLPYANKWLIWLAGSDYELVKRHFGPANDVRVIEHDWAIDRLIVSTDVAVTKANRKTILELQHLGTPSIALSFGLNPIDDRFAKAASGVLFHRAQDLNGEQMSRQVEIALQAPSPSLVTVARAAELAAERISLRL